MSRHGENIWKRKDGRWEARYVKGRDPRGKALYASVYAKTYAEVKKKREAVLQELKSHPSSSLPAKSLGMIIQEYLSINKENNKTKEILSWQIFLADYRFICCSTVLAL